MNHTSQVHGSGVLRLKRIRYWRNSSQLKRDEEKGKVVKIILRSLRRGRACRGPVLIGIASKRTSQAKPLQKKNPAITAPSCRKIGAPAFSLIELIVVMMVIGILATVVIIKFTGVDTQSSRVAANELRSHLTYVRNMAMNRERAMKVQFNVFSNRYDVFMAVGNWTGTYLRARDPVTQKDWIVDLNSKFSLVTLSSVDINNNNTLYFSETNGMPFDTNRVSLTTNGVITFNSGLKVTVAPVTGYAGLQ